MSSAITEAITTIALGETRFNLSLTEDGAFFPNGKVIYCGILAMKKRV
ncbi:hypothetical protein [Microcystis aeruginosa]|nr:hypothetical protein [Microcystis aeruginosa]ELS46206.1 hypothetical protein C789_3962 [Microcystis aeruginosa FACHB-905 = DIANCHI905]